MLPTVLQYHPDCYVKSPKYVSVFHSEILRKSSFSTLARSLHAFGIIISFCNGIKHTVNSHKSYWSSCN